VVSCDVGGQGMFKHGTQQHRKTEEFKHKVKKLAQEATDY